MSDLKSRILYTHIPYHRGPRETYKTVYEEEVAIEVEQEDKRGRPLPPDPLDFIRNGQDVVVPCESCR